jgi:hypothetical protein
LPSVDPPFSLNTNPACPRLSSDRHTLVIDDVAGRAMAGYPTRGPAECDTRRVIIWEEVRTPQVEVVTKEPRTNKLYRGA